jgi:sucrose phosphorylase
MVSNKVQLITYPDSLGGDLKKLDEILNTYFPDLFQGGIHILPPFPSTGDRGFSPLNYLEIDPRFGSWSDIRRIGKKYPILMDLIVNHISSQSMYFQDFLQNCRKSPFADLFIPIEHFWRGNPPQAEIDMFFLRRSRPFSDYRFQGSGRLKTLWTTFGKESPSAQVDIDVTSASARNLFRECLANFSQNNVKVVRLDALPYVIKKRGTTCFFVEPEILEFLNWIREIGDSYNLKLLPEVHAEYSTQQKLIDKGYWIYDFILPYLILEAIVFKNSKKLKAYLANRTYKQYTMLDCHDGIPVKPDLNGILDIGRASRLVDICLVRGGNTSLIFSPNHREPNGFDIHQIRGTYYSLLGCNDQSYLIARAIQFFTPGIPQVYYVGLLAGRNDVKGISTHDGRDINRHNYSIKEVAEEIKKPVVKKLIELIRFRNSHPAFNGTFRLDDCIDFKISMHWQNGVHSASLKIDLFSNTLDVRYTDKSSYKEFIFN